MNFIKCKRKLVKDFVICIKEITLALLITNSCFQHIVFKSMNYFTKNASLTLSQLLSIKVDDEFFSNNID